MKKFATILGMVALVLGPAAVAAEKGSCVPPEKAEALITYLLPGSLKAVGTKCSATLPATASLLQVDSEQFARYQDASDQAWPDAQDVIGLLAGEDLPEGMDMNAFRPMIDAMIPAMVTQQLKPKDCPTIERVYNLLEPLPSANVASLTVMLIQLGSSSREKDPLNICKPLPQ
ncbi:MAG: hypothetical protein AAGE37_08525 [Pseudomonadota bacterium]